MRKRDACDLGHSQFGVVAPRERPDRASVSAIFGDELPQVSSDERDSDSVAEVSDRDRWLRDNVPPHHL